MSNQTIKKPTYTSDTFIIIVGILLLLFAIIYLYNKYKETMLLATTATVPFSICPNYWDSIGNGKCQNTNALGKCSKEKGANIMDFNNEVFINPNTGNYSKCKWASACGVSWSNIERLC